MTALKQVLRYPGSKARIAGWIAGHFPAHESYVEPFAGSAVVLFAKPRSPLELLNDRDGRVTNLFRVMRDQTAELVTAIERTPWARDEYEESLDDSGDAVERARRFLIRCWQGFSSATGDVKGQWLREMRALPGRPSAERWAELPQRIGAVAERLRGVQIENRSAMEIIQSAVAPGVLLYCDPPYLGFEGQYLTEMSEDDHRCLLAHLKEHSGPVVLSGYLNDLYATELDGWLMSSHENRALNTVSRTEVLWINPVAAKAGSQLRMDLR